MNTEQAPARQTAPSRRSKLWRGTKWLLGFVIVVGGAISVITILAAIHTSDREAQLISQLSPHSRVVLKQDIPHFLRMPFCEEFAKGHCKIAVAAHIGVDEFEAQRPDLNGLRPEVRVLQDFRSLRTLIVAPAFIRRDDLRLMPVIPSVEKLVIGNHHSACSETCQIDATREPPPSDEYIWDGTDLEFLRGFIGVRELQLQALWFGSGALKTILSLPRLESVQLHSCRISASEFHGSLAPPRLRVLRIYWQPVSPELSDWVAKCKQVRELDVVVPWYHQNEKELDLAFIPQQVETLRLDGARLNSDAWKRIASLPRLRILTVKDARLDLPVSENMPRLSNLEWLDVRSLRRTLNSEKITLLNAAGDHCEILVDDSIDAEVRRKVEARVLKRLRFRPREDLEHQWGY